MAVQTELNDCPFKTDRVKEIESVLDNVPVMNQSQLQDFALKMNYAIATGQLPSITAAEAAALKTISAKCIQDAPKQINLDATVKSEQIIMSFLQDNDKLLEVTNKRILKQSTLELEQLSRLDGFAANFLQAE